MSKPVTHPTDYAFAQRILAGDATAIAEFQKLFSDRVAASLAKHATSRNAQIGRDVASDFMVDCVTKTRGPKGNVRPPKLIRYDGTAPLSAIVHLWAHAALIDRLRRRRPEVSGDGAADGDKANGDPDASGADHEEPAEVHILSLVHHGLLYALDEADDEDVVLMRLAFLLDVPQNSLAWMLEKDPGTICRKIERTVTDIKKNVLSYIRRRDPDLAITANDIDSLSEMTRQILWDDVPPPRSRRKIFRNQ